MSFERALPLILRLEGGYVNDLDDRGGATNKGVTTATFHRWLDQQGLPQRHVREITEDEVRAIYVADYWQAAHCHRLPWPAALVVFDGAVNHGVGRSVRFLQEALNVKVDGVVGPVTLAAIEGADAEQLADEVLWLRAEFYYEISTGTQIKFLRGWLRRLFHVRKGAGLA